MIETLVFLESNLGSVNLSIQNYIVNKMKKVKRTDILSLLLWTETLYGFQFLSLLFRKLYHGLYYQPSHIDKLIIIKNHYPFDITCFTIRLDQIELSVNQ